MIESVSIAGVGPFRRRAEFPVAGVGLVLVRGDNRASSSADSNGVGKTALWSFGLSWGAFGETLAGERGDEVLNRFSTGPGLVEVIGVDAGTKRHWKVVRGRRPKRVEAWEWSDPDVSYDGEPTHWSRVLAEADDRDVNAWVEDRYLPWRVFRNAVVFDRDVRFTRAGQDEQMRMLDRVQGVDFRAALSRAKAWRDGAEETRSASASAASAARSALEEAEAAAAELATLRDGFADAKAARVEAAAARCAEAVEAFHAAARALPLARKAAKRAAALRERADAIRALSDEAEARARESDSAAADAESDERSLARTARRIDDLVSAGRCPTCRRPVPGASSVRGGFAGELSELTKAVKASALTAMTALQASKSAASELSALARGETAEAAEASAREAERASGPLAVAAAERAFDDASKAVAEAAAAEKSALAERWSGAAAMKAAERRVDELRADAERAERDGEKAERWLRVADYWVEAFGDRGVRSLLFESVAGFLEARAAAHLEALSAGEARLAVSATTALKGGGARERLSIVPEWAWGGLGQAAESGGQDTRTDLATFWAIRDLAEARSARAIAPAILDEPEGLDARGQELFGAWVTAEARRIGSVFLMTHNPALAACVEADEEWRVVLRGPGDATLEREK